MPDQQNVPTYMVDLDQIRAYIRALLAEKHITIAQLATITGITVGTLANFFDGTTKAPSFDKVCTIIVKLGGSVDAALGMVHTDQPRPAVDLAPIFEAHNQVIAAKDANLADLRAEVAGISNELETERGRVKQSAKWQKLFVAENILFAVMLVFHLLSDLLLK